MKNKLLTTLLILAPFTASAQQQGLSDIVNNVSTTAESVVNLFVLGAMIAGIIFIIVGIYGMKKASDPQAQATYGQALIKVGVGALLMTPLGVVNIAKNTTGVGENTLNLKKGSFSFSNNGNATPPPAEFTLP